MDGKDENSVYADIIMKCNQILIELANARGKYIDTGRFRDFIKAANAQIDFYEGKRYPEE